MIFERWQPKYLVIGPGPCSPRSWYFYSAIQHFAGKIPLLGVCLGHQSIGQAFGGIIRAKTVMHGRLSTCITMILEFFSHLPSPFSATRYHSLVIDQASLPDCLEVVAGRRKQMARWKRSWCKTKTLPVEGGEVSS